MRNYLEKAGLWTCLGGLFFTVFTDVEEVKLNVGGTIHGWGPWTK